MLHVMLIMHKHFLFSILIVPLANAVGLHERKQRHLLPSPPLESAFKKYKGRIPHAEIEVDHLLLFILYPCTVVASSFVLRQQAMDLYNDFTLSISLAGLPTCMKKTLGISKNFYSIIQMCLSVPLLYSI